MAISPVCSKCQSELDEPGALLLSPPDGELIKKFHLCLKCYGELITQVSGGVTDERIYERAAELAELVSGVIWGGDHGWERATEEQFETLKREARRRLRTT